MSRARAALSRKLAALLRRNSHRNQERRRFLKRLARKLNFVFFGVVDQRVDDYQVVRGFTTSSSHWDANYMVGNFEDYNVRLVDRSDVIQLPDKSHEAHQWLVIEMDAKLRHPYVFMVPKHQGATHYRRIFKGPKRLESLTLDLHSPEFSSRYAIFGAPDQINELEDSLTPAITNVLSAHLWPAAIEIFEGSLYLYTVETKLTEQLVHTMLKNGAWLADALAAKK